MSATVLAIAILVGGGAIGTQKTVEAPRLDFPAGPEQVWLACNPSVRNCR